LYTQYVMPRVITNRKNAMKRMMSSSGASRIWKLEAH